MQPNTAENPARSGFSSTNMNLSEPTRFLIFLVKDVPLLIVKSPFKVLGFLFSFERFYLWDLARILHFVTQVVVFILIMKASQYEVAYLPFNLLGVQSHLVLWISAFVFIRIVFELLLVLLGIHNKLSTIADELKSRSEAKN